VNNRRTLLDYLKKKDHERYREVISQLGLRRWLSMQRKAWPCSVFAWWAAASRCPGTAMVSLDTWEVSAQI